MLIVILDQIISNLIKKNKGQTYNPLCSSLKRNARRGLGGSLVRERIHLGGGESSSSSKEDDDDGFRVSASMVVVEIR